MRLKLPLKNVLVSAIFAISALAAFLAFFGKNNLDYLPQFANAFGIHETTGFPKYNLGDIPISLGKIEKDKNVYFHLKHRFSTDGIEGHPNLLQTAPLNKGLRIEFNGSTAAIVVADSNAKDGYRAIVLSNAINIGATHELEIEALNAGYVRAILDGQNVADVSSTGISMDVSQFLVGGGFDNTRVFRGQIDNVSIKKGNLLPSIAAVARYIPNTLYSSHIFCSLIANSAFLVSIMLCFFINSVIKATSTRFDRRLVNGWWIRLPQEDFCQATGLPPERKYEEQGVGGIAAILDILRGSNHAELDRTNFLTAQLIFWLLADPDGHAKNFSIALGPQGQFWLTPLYDIMSAWPVIGKGAREFQLQNVKLAMALHSKNTHYQIAKSNADIGMR